MKLDTNMEVVPARTKQRWRPRVAKALETAKDATYKTLTPPSNQPYQKQIAYDKVSAFIDTGILLDGKIRGKEFFKGYGFVEFSESAYEFQASNVLINPRRHDGFEQIRIGMNVRFLVTASKINSDGLSVEIVIKEISK